MSRSLSFILLLTLVPIGFSGCARYEDYSRAVVESNETRTNARIKIAKQVVNTIINEFDKANPLIKNGDNKQPLATFEWVDIDGVSHKNTVYHTPPDPGITFFMKGAAKAMVIRETVPLVTAIIDDMTQNIAKPVTVEDIVMRVAEDATTLATMGMVYGVTKEVVDNARSNITANAYNDSQVAIDNTGPSVSSPLQDNSVKTEIPEVEPEIEE